jgi:hypothetical protein
LTGIRRRGRLGLRMTIAVTSSIVRWCRVGVLRRAPDVAKGRDGAARTPQGARMCGRVRSSSGYSEIKIALKFDLGAPAPNFEADWKKPPTLVAMRSEDGKRIPKMRRWCLLPRSLVGGRRDSGPRHAADRGHPLAPRRSALSTCCGRRDAHLPSPRRSSKRGRELRLLALRSCHSRGY